MRVALAFALLLAIPTPVLAGPFRPATFDLGAARRPDDLAAEEIAASTRTIEGIQVSEVRFSSTEWDAQGNARSIRIAGYLAVPPGTGSKPIVIALHGLGGAADPQHAASIARNVDVVALAISAPGLGASEGSGPTAADPRPIFTATPDVRGSWLYAYAFATMRAITYAQTRPEVDRLAVVVTGVSMGGIVSYLVGGTDDRIKGILPVSASGGLERAVLAGSWWRNLVKASFGAKPGDPGPRAVFRSLDPLAFARGQRGTVYAIVGAQDEFFPIDQVIATHAAVRAPGKSLALIADYDHQWYFGFGCPAHCMPGSPPAVSGAPPCPASPICPSACPPGARPPYCGPGGSYNRQDEFITRWALLLRSQVAPHAHPPRPFAAPPPAPTVRRRAAEVVVTPGSGPLPKAVRLAISDNGGHTYGQYLLERRPDGTYRHPGRVPASAILIAEVEGAEGAVSTSLPTLPRGFRPRVRPFGPHP